MSHTDRPDQPCGRGYVELRDYFTLWLERLEVFYNRRLEDLDNKTMIALTAADKAVTKAEMATEKRFEGVNEFRQALADQATRLMPREETLSKFENMQKEVATIAREIQERRNQLAERGRDESSFKQGWIIPLIVIGTIAVVNLLINLGVFHK